MAVKLLLYWGELSGRGLAAEAVDRGVRRSVLGGDSGEGMDKTGISGCTSGGLVSSTAIGCGDELWSPLDGSSHSCNNRTRARSPSSTGMSSSARHLRLFGSPSDSGGPGDLVFSPFRSVPAEMEAGYGRGKSKSQSSSGTFRRASSLGTI